MKIITNINARTVDNYFNKLTLSKINLDGFTNEIKQLEEFCGFIKNNDKDLMKCSSARMVLLKLNEKYSLQIEAKIKNIYFNDHYEYFEYGIQKSKNKNSIYSRTRFVRLKFIENKIPSIKSSI